MKCENCNSEKITVFSEYIETKEKDGQGLFAFLYLVSAIALIVAFLFLFLSLNKTTNAPIEQISEFITGTQIITIAIPFLFLTMILKRLVPFKHVTKTKVVCLECGKTWYLENKVCNETDKNNDEDKKD